MRQPSSVDDYLATLPDGVQEVVLAIRRTIHDAAPDAFETISYGMPTFKMPRWALYVGAFRHHVTLFTLASPGVIEAFRHELEPYDASKGHVKFRFDQPVPYALIGDMVRYRVREMVARDAPG